MNSKQWISLAVVALVFGGVGFFGGMKYQQSKTPTRQGQFAQFGNGQLGARRGGQNGQGFATGSIIAKDDKSITLKNQMGGSTIVFYSSSTAIGKTATGTPEDLSLGENVIATGSSNSGGITATNIQIRPAAANLQR